jgi:hypothetical protein
MKVFNFVAVADASSGIRVIETFALRHKFFGISLALRLWLISLGLFKK